MKYKGSRIDVGFLCNNFLLRKSNVFGNFGYINRDRDTLKLVHEKTKQ